MNKIYPPKFAEYCKNPNLKGAFVSIVEPSRASDCKNCGGIGTLIIFLATEGPYEYLPSGLIAKWANNKWWGGKSVEEACPICHGMGNDTNYVQPPLHIRNVEIPIFKSVPEVNGFSDV